MVLLSSDPKNRSKIMFFFQEIFLFFDDLIDPEKDSVSLFD